MIDLLVDTDAFIDHLQGRVDIVALREAIGLSTVSRCELFAGADADEPAIERLLETFKEFPVDPQVARVAGRIRRATKIRTPDALIAATALEHGLGLLTRNAKDFRRVEGLRIQAP